MIPAAPTPCHDSPVLCSMLHAIRYMTSPHTHTGSMATVPNPLRTPRTSARYTPYYRTVNQTPKCPALPHLGVQQHGVPLAQEDPVHAQLTQAVSNLPRPATHQHGALRGSRRVEGGTAKRGVRVRRHVFVWHARFDGTPSAETWVLGCWFPL